MVLFAAFGAMPHAIRTGEQPGPEPERLAMIERLKAAAPNNPLPWIYSAAELLKSGPSEEALAELRAGLERPAFYTYTSEQMDASKLLWEEKGFHPDIAGILGTGWIPIYHATPVQQTARMLMDLQKTASDSGDTQRANSALQSAYEMGRLFSSPESSRLLVGQLIGFAFESKALKALPEGAKPDWLAIDPAVRIAEIEQRKKIMTEAPGMIATLIQRRDSSSFSEYVRRLRFESEWEALEWLRAQNR